MPPLKVVHLSSVHHPFDTRIFYRECASLAQAGYDVTLIAPAAPAPPSAADTNVRLVGLPAVAGKRDRLARAVPALFRLAIQADAWLYHFHDPELIPVGLALKQRGHRVVYDVHEDVPRQILNKHWLPGPVRGVLGPAAEAAEVAAGWRLDGIVAATRPIADRFPEGKTALVQNFPVFEELRGAGGLPYAARPPVAAYVGSMTTVRGIAELVAAIGQVNEALAPRLVLAGEFDERALHDRVRADPGWSRVSAPGRHSRDQVQALLGTARMGLVTLHPTPSYVLSQPVKLYEYMAAGLPVIASDFPPIRAVVAEANCGLLVDPLDPAAIAEAITWVLTHPLEAEAMGRRGQAAVKARYCWDQEAASLLGLYERLRTPSRRAA